MEGNYDDDPWVVYRTRVPVEYKFLKLSAFEEMETTGRAERGNTLCVHVPEDAGPLFKMLQEEEEQRTDLFRSTGPGALEYDFLPHVITMSCMPFYHRALMRATEVAVVCHITELCVERYEATMHGANANINRSRIFSHCLETDHDELHFLDYASALLYAFALMAVFLHDGSPIDIHNSCARGARSISEQFASAVSTKWPTFYRIHIQPLFCNELVDGRPPKVPFVVELDE